MDKYDRKTLLLDSSFQVMSIIDWKTAITLIYLNKAQSVEDYDDFIVRSISTEMKVPSILRMNSKLLNKYRKINVTRYNIFKRDKYTCAYCGNKSPKKNLTIDHIIPLSRNGDKKSWNNLITACQPCNQKKSDKTPQEARMPLIFKPIEPKWSPRFFLNISNFPESWDCYIY